MTDKLTPEQRHLCMSHIRSKDTKPELKVRRWLWSNGYRYRLNVKSVPGKPDIVMRRYRTAIFVNGCFWHGHNVQFGEGATANSRCCKIPQSNRDFWVGKIRRNQERDRSNCELLRQNGWQVIVIWECQLTAANIGRTMREVELLLNENLLSLYRPRPLPYGAAAEDAALPVAADAPDSQETNK